MYKNKIILRFNQAQKNNNTYTFNFNRAIHFKTFKIQFYQKNMIIDDLNILKTKSPNEYYFNSYRTDNYVEDGSRAKPYKSIDKFQEILVSTPRKIKVSLVGDFMLSQKIEINHQDWDIHISGGNIQMQDISEYCFKVLNAKRFVSEKLSIKTCLYGIRTYTCQEVKIINCDFENCGSTGLDQNHIPTRNGSELANIFAQGTELSNGGALRIQANKTRIQGNKVKHCLRAIRIQDSTLGAVLDNIVESCSDNGIYLRDSSNILVQSNTIINCLHCGLLSINSHNCQFITNNIQKCAGASLIQFSSSNVDYISNTCHENCRLNHNGYSTSCDNTAQIYLNGSVTQSCDYLCKIFNNNFTKTTTVNNNILAITADFNSYQSQGGNVLFMSDNKFDQALAESLGSWQKTSLQSSSSSGYTNQEINNLLNQKQNSLNTQQLSVLNGNPFNSSNYYLKSEVDNVLDDKQDTVTTDSLDISDILGLQTTLDSKQNNIFTGNRLNAQFIGDNSNITNTEYGYLNGVSSNIQTQLDSKQANITYASNIEVNELQCRRLDCRDSLGNNIRIQAPSASNAYTLSMPNSLPQNNTDKYLTSDTSGNLSWSSSAGSSSNNQLALLEGVDWNSNAGHALYPLPELPLSDQNSGRTLVFFGFDTIGNNTPNWTGGNNAFGHQYVRLPAYGTCSPGATFPCINVANGSKYVYLNTYSYGEDGTNSTNQLIYKENLLTTLNSTSNYQTQRKNVTTGDRHFRITLLNREQNGWELWLLGINN